MLNLPADAAVAFRYNIMDKTLADYITRTMAQLENENRQKVHNNRNVWNDTESASQDIYNVYPELQSQDSDEKINPYGQH
jgi:hypothetical protein